MKGFLKGWSPAIIFVALLAFGVLFSVRGIVSCRADGGTWIGGITRTAFCAPPADKDEFAGQEAAR